MKKLIFLSTILLAVLIFTGCVQQAPSQNQNINEASTKINQNININTDAEKPIVNINQNIDDKSLQIINKIPEGTTGGTVDEDKVIKGTLDELNVIFNNNIDESTLTSDNFYALWGIDDKIPSSIVYNKQTKTATLKFDNPLAAQSEQILGITVVLQNIKDLDGNLLDKYI